MADSIANKRVGRRTIAKGAAWTVPAIAVAAPVAAAAASGEPTVTSTGKACKLPGASCVRQVGVRKGYAIAVIICHDFYEPVTFDWGQATGTLCGDVKIWSVGPDPLTVDPGTPTCRPFTIGLDGEPNSQNCPIDGSVPYTWSTPSGNSGSGTLYFSAPSTPPCTNCDPHN